MILDIEVRIVFFRKFSSFIETNDSRTSWYTDSLTTINIQGYFCVIVLSQGPFFAC